MTDKITLDRTLVEQALDAFAFAYNACESDWVMDEKIDPAIKQLEAALEQPDIEIPASVPEGWKLVPVEPTDDMLYDIQEYSHILPPRGRRIWAHMLAAAPQPPTVKEAKQQQVEQEPVAWEGRDGYLYHFIEEPKPCDRPLYTHPQNLNCKSNQARLATLWGYVKADQPPVVEQPQVEQEPVAWLHADGKHQPLYTHPQPKREPLPDTAIYNLWDKHFKSWIGGEQFEAVVRAIEAKHNIKEAT